MRKIFSEIEENTKKLVPIYINCQIDNTKFAIFSRFTGDSPVTSLPPAPLKQVFNAIARMLLKEEVG